MSKEQRQTQGIKNSWPLVDFAKAHGRMSTLTMVAKNGPNAGQAFPTCRFAGKPAENGKPAVGMVFCAFSEKLGALTPAQIAAQKDELQVVELAVSGNFMLCKAGAFEGEELVDLGL